MIIREERAEDFCEIRALVKEAFVTAKVSNGKEQDFVTFLRGKDTYIPDLALVAEEDGRIIGHIMLTKTAIFDGDKKQELLLLAPLCVALAYRNNGLGATLVEQAFVRARTKGYTAAVLVGDPHYYERFGFMPLQNFGIENSNGIPAPYVLAYELVPDALHKVKGFITFMTGDE